MKEVSLQQLMNDQVSSPLGIQDLLGELRHYVKGYHDDKYVLRFDNGYGAVVYDEATEYPLTAYWVRWPADAKELTDYRVASDGLGKHCYVAKSPTDLQASLTKMSEIVSPYVEL